MTQTLHLSTTHCKKYKNYIQP